RSNLLFHQDTAEADVLIAGARRPNKAKADGQPVSESSPGTAACNGGGTPFPDIAAHVVETILVGAKAADILGLLAIAQIARDRVLQRGFVHVKVPLRLRRHGIE